jgi:SAM-dependent methyltransferase
MMEVATCVICNGTVFIKDRTCKDYTVSKEDFTLLKCTACDFVFTSPRPEDQDLGKYYISEDYISHAREAKSLTDKIYSIARNVALTWKTNLIQKLFTHKPSVLDYGAGTGTFAKACSDKGWTTKGVEPSDIARDAADKSITLYPELKDVRETNFDVISLWHVLEHIPDIDTALNNIIDKLKPGGYLLIAVPNKHSYDAKKYGDYWAGYDVPRHLWHFSKQNIQDLFIKKDLKVEKIVPMKLDAFYVSLLSANYKHPDQKLLNLIRGFTNGLISNLNAMFDGEYSSLLYIIKK